MKNNETYIYQIENCVYPANKPYHPHIKYPEYPFKEVSNDKNSVYDGFRNLLKNLNLDIQNFGTNKWNPLGEYIKPNQVVLIKPNMVIHPLRDIYDIEALVSHGSLIRVIMDYVFIALGGKGKIIIGDSPLQSANFDEIIELNGILSVFEFFKEKQKKSDEKSNLDVELIDFRTERLELKERSSGLILERRPIKLNGDTNGYKEINLKSRSRLYPIREDYLKYRVTDYNPTKMKNTHNLEDNKYLIPNSVLMADIVIHVPKMKTHRKAGITGCLKNNVGINGHKDWLPHHRIGSNKDGGDEYQNPNYFKRLVTKINEFEDKYQNSKLIQKSFWLTSFFKTVAEKFSKIKKGDSYSEGSWYGNNTLWRTILDLNKILLYTDKNGDIKEDPQRKRLYVVDGIFAGDEEGPLEPHTRKEGLILFGQDPAVVDLVIAELMGFDYEKIPSIKNSFEEIDLKITNEKPENITFLSNKMEWNNKLIDNLDLYLNFKPTKGWKNHIEKNFHDLDI